MHLYFPIFATLLYFYPLAKAQPYRVLLAALLALLYLFIVTPVQYWHRHEPAATAQSGAEGYQWCTISGADTATSCAICAHSYAASSNDAVLTTLTANFSYSVIDSLQVIVFRPHFIGGCSNKSPPHLPYFNC